MCIYIYMKRWDLLNVYIFNPLTSWHDFTDNIQDEEVRISDEIEHKTLKLRHTGGKTKAENTWHYKQCQN